MASSGHKMRELNASFNSCCADEAYKSEAVK